MHIRLFPQQFWAFLKRLGQKVLAVIVAVLMPFSILLGVILQTERDTRAGVSLEPLANLIYIEPPAEAYGEVPPTGAGDRRGVMEEGRRDDRCLELVIDAPVTSYDSVLWFTQWSLQPTEPLYTTLPNAANYLFRHDVEIRPLWMYG